MRLFLKHGLGAAALGAALLAASPAQAQNNAHVKDTHVGLGAALNLGGPTIVQTSNFTATTLGSFFGGSVVLPIDIKGVIRVEPELFFTHVDPDTDDDDDAVSVVRPGVGVFYMFSPVDDVAGFIGGRLSPTIFLTSGEDDDVFFTIGPAFGAEYYFSKYFSIGAEAQINFFTDLAGDADVFVMGTNAVLGARVFLM